MKRTNKPLSEHMKARTEKKVKQQEAEGNTENMTSTGSTLLDLAISGSRIEGGGLPAGILVEIFGPSGAGKTVLLSEIAGNIQRRGGEVMFHDPEARLNQQFAQIFDLDVSKISYDTPDTVPQLFKAVREWEVDTKKINGIMADSLAALSTDMEMDNDDGDKMGGRRAKEFSEQLRKTARILKSNNLLMVCSNQIRETMNTMPFQEKFTAPGGKGIGFYSSVRIQLQVVKKITRERTFKGKKLKEIIGVRSEAYIYKNSVSSPFKRVPITIDFQYGIDDIRENLQFIKDHSTENIYTIGKKTLSKSMQESINIVENESLEDQLRNEVIRLWSEIQKLFEVERKPKSRF